MKQLWNVTKFQHSNNFATFCIKPQYAVSKRSKLSDAERSKIKSPIKKRRHTSQTFVVNASWNCRVKRHSLYLCNTLKQISVQNHIDTVKNTKVCYNCLRSHRDRFWKFSNYIICQKHHNTLTLISAHPLIIPTHHNPITQNMTIRADRQKRGISFNNIKRVFTTLLTSALVHVYGDNHKKFVKYCALLDMCATANFITESIVKRLGHTFGRTLPINTINETSTISKGIVWITISIHTW